MAPMAKKDVNATPEQLEHIAEELRSDAEIVDRFKELGFTKDQSIKLSKVVHLSVATVRETYIKKGCSPDLAFKILSD